MECQSRNDKTMVLRMVEYDFMIGLSMAEDENGTYRIHFPRSCVIYLRQNGNTPAEEDEKEFADSVLQVSVTANRRIADELKGGNAEMCQALMELMEPEIRQIRQESRILEYIDIRREDDYTDKRIMEDLMKKFALTAKEAEEYLKERITV